MRLTLTKINLIAVFTTALAIWLGVTGRVDWWVIVLFLSTHFELEISLR